MLKREQEPTVMLLLLPLRGEEESISLQFIFFVYS